MKNWVAYKKSVTAAYGRFIVFNVNFEHISPIFQVFLLLTLSLYLFEKNGLISELQVRVINRKFQNIPKKFSNFVVIPKKIEWYWLIPKKFWQNFKSVNQKLQPLPFRMVVWWQWLYLTKCLLTVVQIAILLNVVKWRECVLLVKNTTLVIRHCYCGSISLK